MTREQMLARQNEILQAARAESRAMTAEERAEFDTLQRSIEALDRAGATAGGEGSSRGAAAGEGEGNGDEGGEGNGDGARSAVENERARIRQIEEMCRDFGMNEQVRGFIDNGTTVERDTRRLQSPSTDSRRKEVSRTSRHTTIIMLQARSESFWKCRRMAS